MDYSSKFLVYSELCLSVVKSNAIFVCVCVCVCIKWTLIKWLTDNWVFFFENLQISYFPHFLTHFQFLFIPFFLFFFFFFLPFHFICKSCNRSMGSLIHDLEVRVISVRCWDASIQMYALTFGSAVFSKSCFYANVFFFFFSPFLFDICR